MEESHNIRTGRFKRWGLWAAIIVTSAIVGARYFNLFGERAAEAKAADQEVAVTTTKAKQGALPVVIPGLGSVQPLQSVPIRSRLEGEILQLPFKEGDAVKAGDVIAKIDPKKSQAALDQAIAKKAQDQALLVSAQSDLARYRDLASKGYASQQYLEQKTAAEAQLARAVEGDTAAINSAQTDLSFSTIKSPIAGRLGFRNLDKGSIIVADGTTAIVTVTQISPIGVVFYAPGSKFADIREAMANGTAMVEARATDDDRLLATGRLSVVDNNVDTTTGAIRLKAVFKNDDEILWPGLAVSTRLILKMQDGVVVSDRALLRGSSGLYAFVVQDNARAKRREVDAPIIVDGKALVATGISDGEDVVEVGADRLGEGTKIVIAPAAPIKKAALETTP